MEKYEYGKHFGKFDIERWGFFGEMSYLHGAKYFFPRMSNQRGVGRQMLPGFPKWKAGLQDCYFEKEFKRIFTGEAYKPLYKLYAKQSLESATKFLTPSGIRYPSGSKMHSTPGDHYGTFGGIIPAFSPKTFPREMKGSSGLRNMLAKPGKKGGPGYSDVGINPFPPYVGDKYDTKDVPRSYKLTNAPFKGPDPPGYFDRNPFLVKGTPVAHYSKLVDEVWKLNGEFVPSGTGKPLGGHKGGGFSKFPEYMTSRYIDPWRIEQGDHKGKGLLAGIFSPPSGNKNKATYSIANLNVDFRVNEGNYRKMKPLTFTREIL